MQPQNNKQKTLSSRRCLYLQFIVYNLSSRWHCWSMWSFVLRFVKSCEPFSGLQPLCAHLGIYTSILGRNTIHRHSPNKTPEILQINSFVNLKYRINFLPQAIYYEEKREIKNDSKPHKLLVMYNETWSYLLV